MRFNPIFKKMPPNFKGRSKITILICAAGILGFFFKSGGPLYGASDESRSVRHVQRGNEMREMNDYQGAILDYNEAIRLDPLNADAFLNRGITRQKMKETDYAIDDFTTAIRIDPTLSRAYVKRGLISLEKKDTDAALIDFSEAIRVNPENTEPYYLRAQTKYDLKDYTGAVADYSSALALNSDEPSYLAGRGKTLEKLGDLKGAMSDYTETIERFPGYAKAYYLRGNLHLETGDITKAMREFDKAIKTSIRSDGALLMRGFIAYVQGKSKKALNDMRECQKILQEQEALDYVQLWIWLVETQLGQPDAADAELTSYYNRREKGHEAINTWYEKLIHFILGEIDEETLIAEASESDDPEKVEGYRCEAFFYAAQLRQLRGDYNGSIALLEQSVATGLNDFYEYKGARIQLSMSVKE